MMAMMNLVSVFAVFALQVLANVDGTTRLRGVERLLHSGSHNDTKYPNGTVSVEGGHFIKDPVDTEENRGSIIWTGQGNNPNANGEQADFDTGSLTCFSELVTAETPNGAIAMKDLTVGDKILVGSGEFETIYAFAHRNPNRMADFVTIATSGDVLELTSLHLVFLEKHDNPLRADAVRVGDILRGETQPVTKIGKIQREGIYAPLTKSGTLVANGVVSSNYVALQESSHFVLGGVEISHHTYVHMGMSPFRLYCGLSDKFCNSYDEDGMPPYVAFSIWLSRWVYAQHVFLQFWYTLVFFMVTSLCCLLEAPLGAAAAGASLYWILCKKHKLHDVLDT